MSSHTNCVTSSHVNQKSSGIFIYITQVYIYIYTHQTTMSRRKSKSENNNLGESPSRTAVSAARRTSARRAAPKKSARQMTAEEKSNYFRKPLLGRKPVTECEQELEDALEKECRQTLHIGAQYIAKGDGKSAHTAPYAVQQLSSQKRLQRQISSTCMEELKGPDLSLRPSCGENYNFPGIPSEEVYWFFSERARTKKWGPFFAQYPTPEPPPYRNATEEKQSRAIMLEALQEWQRMKDAGEVVEARRRRVAEPKAKASGKRAKSPNKAASRKAGSKKSSGKRATVAAKNNTASGSRRSGRMSSKR